MKFTFPPESKPLAGYAIKRGIHRGAFGEVYYAHTDAGKEVALKLLQSQMEVELRGVRQCLNLKHPHLVSLYDIRVDDDGDHWIVMEYVAGRSLAEVLDDHPDGLPLDEVVRWIDGMASGLDFLHDRGIVHRDLKPANVFIEDGVVKIGDVGLSKYISQSRRNEQTQSVGTVYYMAPEVAHGRYGQEVDVYSLGIVLYELLTGRVPFDGESTGEILMKHLTDEPDLALVDEAYRPVLVEALAKDPAERTRTTGELAEAFRHAAALAPVATPVSVGAGTAMPAPRPVRRAVDVPPLAELTRPGDGNDGVPPGSAEDFVGVGPSDSSDGSAHAGFTRWMKSAWHGPHKTWYRWGTAAGMVVLIASGVGPILLAFGAIVYAAKLALEAAVNAFDKPRRDEPKTEESFVEVVSKPPEPPPPPPPPPVVEPVRRAKGGEWLTPETPRSLPLRQRVAELSGALAYAGPLTLLVTAGLLLAMPILPLGGGMSADPGSIGLFAGVTLLGSWAILGTAKLVEGHDSKILHRRLAYFLVGGLVGFGAFWLHRNLFVHLSDGVFAHGQTWVLGPPGRSLFRHGVVDAQKYMLFFGLLFAFRRWWWHVDGFRAERFRVWTVVVTTLVALLLAGILAFPALWAALWAVSICSVVQLSAAWMPPEQRYVRVGRTSS